MSAEPLVSYLRQLQAMGQTHVSVDDDARLILREFYMRARAGNAAVVEKEAQSLPVRQPESKSEVKFSETPVEPATLAASALTVSGGNAREKIENLRQQAEKWKPARDLGSLRQTMVFSTGNPEADVMLVGEAPGFDEERLREPFVGKAGQKLDNILRAMGLDRKQCYLSNIVKFRPAMSNQTTNNRKPTKDEMASCMPFIEQEVSIVEPKVIIALGGTAAHALLGCDLAVAKMRGSFHTFHGIALRVTYHPSYILHNEATSEKRKLWEDMLEVMGFLGMPVSDKQKSFFLTK
ncbi:MAG: uracil-DNA glycosylase [Akkermansiaceae bacterium]|nr:uracil-DNA glycosylase [Akkermansiaceae bacterium]